MPTLSGQAAIVGAWEHPGRRIPDRTALQLQAECALAALADAGLSMAQVDAMYTASVPGMAMVLPEYLNIHPRIVGNTTVGGASPEFHLADAVAAIAAGRCNVAVIVYGEISSTIGRQIGTGVRARTPTAYPAWYVEIPYGETTVANYALVAQRHMYEYGTTSEQLAEIAVAVRGHAARNPNAKYRDPITVDDVVQSRLIADPLHMLDCCVISDGGGAIVVASPEVARTCKKPPVWVLGVGTASEHASMGKRNLTRIAAAQSAPEAFAMAGVRPADVNMCMVYDSFTITALVTLEDLGFCKKGEGGAFVQGGRLTLEGGLPLNTDGGGLSSNHPGMRGMFLMLEATRQIRGESTSQVRDCRIALAHGTGGGAGSRHSGGTAIFGRERP